MKKIIADLLKGRLFGHPVHMMLVHFPSALLPVSLLSDFTAIILKEDYYFTFGFYLAVIGAVSGWIALSFGLGDLLRIDSGHPAFNKALLHGGLNFLWLVLFSIVAGIEIKNYPYVGYSTLVLYLKILSVSGLLYSNFLGGELVLKYGIGKKE